MASPLVWELTKNYNSFLIKKNGKTFSKDPFNPSGLNIKSHSGLVNSKVAAVCSCNKQELKNGNKASYTVVLRTKKSNGSKAHNGAQFKKVICKRGVHSAVKVLKGKMGKKACLSVKKAYLVHKAAVRKAAALKK